MLHPCALSLGRTPHHVAISEWPRLAQALAANLRLRISPGTTVSQGGAERWVSPRLAWQLPEPAILDRIVDLWSRMLIPRYETGSIEPGWSDFVEVFDASCNPPPPPPECVLAPGHVEAALAFTLERGRAILDAVAEIGSPILARSAPRSPMRFAAGRPWLGGNQPPVQFAAAADVGLPLDEKHWLEPHFDLTRAARNGGGSAEPTWPKAEEIAHAALGKGESLDDLLERLSAAHYFATRAAAPSPAVVDPRIETARRRIGALLNYPTLQRLFGLALDLEVPVEELVKLGDGSGALALALDTDPRCWTLARIIPAVGDRSASFAPLSKAPGFASELGVRNLGEITGASPRYELVTVETSLANESQLTRQVSGTEPSAAGPVDLRHGGLRLIDRSAAPQVAAASARASSDHARAIACAAGATLVKGAEELHIGDRFMVGVRTDRGMAWRMPAYRHITFADPAVPRGAPADWIERELVRRGLGRRTARRMDLDLAPTQLATGEQHITGSELPISVVDGSLASWGGDTMGVPPAGPGAHGRPERRNVERAVGELDVTRTFEAPSRNLGDSPAFLGMPMRFGWPVFVAEILSFPAGAGVSPAEAAAAIERTPSLSLPAIRTYDVLGRQQPGHGHRLLRHEPIHAPVIAFPAAHHAAIRRLRPTQDGGDMIVRTSTRPAARLTMTRRLLLPPSVPLFFAALHGVVHGSPPRWQDVRLMRSAQDQPTLLSVTPGASSSYLPDPAAQAVVLRLRHPAGGWLGDPLLFRLARNWPGITPIQVELRATPTPGPRLNRGGQVILMPGTDAPGANAAGFGIAAEQVTVDLARGEQAELHSWFVPSADRLAEWFDAVTAAAVLATVEGGSADAAGSDACTRGLAALLGQMSEGLTTSVAGPRCVGPGGLTMPEPQHIRGIAGMLHQRMLREPVPIIAAVQRMTLTHASDRGSLETPQLHTAAVVRRSFAQLEVDPSLATEQPPPLGFPDRLRGTRVDFLGLASSDWSLVHNQEGATGIAVGGTVSLDPCAVSGLVVTGSCAAPFSDPLDIVGFEPSRTPRLPVELLRIDGLPRPPDGKAGRRSFDLAELQAVGLAQRRGATELRVAMPATLRARGARRLSLTVSVVGRHEGLMPDDTGPSSKTSSPVDVWLASTIRPAPPQISHVQQALVTRNLPRAEVAGTVTTGIERSTIVRVWMSGGWWSSGEDERLGVVFWPPNIIATGPLHDDTLNEILRVEFLDSDLGSGGSYVTRWGANAQRDGPAPTEPLMLPSAFGYRSGRSASDTEGDVRFVRKCYMPLPLEGAPELVLGGAAEQHNVPAADRERDAPRSLRGPEAAASNAEDGPQASGEFFPVALLTYAPRYHHEEKLWFVDLAIGADSLALPRIRLGLVRYQEHAREDDEAVEGEEPVRLRVSIPVREWIEPLPGRRAQATTTRLPNAARVAITLEGPTSLRLDAQQGGPAIRMELRRRRGVTDEVVLGEDGQPCRASSRGVNPAVVNVATSAGQIWTTLFIVPRGFEAGWQYAATIEENEWMRPANPEAAVTGILDFNTTVESGSRFVARIEL